MSGTRTRNNDATAILKTLLAERIDVDAVIESAKNPSNDTLPSYQDDSASLPVEFTTFIEKPKLTLNEKQQIKNLVGQAKEAVISKNLPLATALLGPAIFKITNETNHSIRQHRETAIKHQIEFSLTTTMLSVIENHFIKKQEQFLRLTYQTSNGTALVKLLRPNNANPTDTEIKTERSKRNDIITPELQQNILNDFYNTLPADEVKDLIARVNTELSGYIDVTRSEKEIKERVIFVLREKWLSVEYLSPVTKDLLIAQAKSTLEKTKTDFLATLMPVIEKTLRSERNDVSDATVHNIRNELTKYFNNLINLTLKEVNETITADGNKTAKGALLDLNDKVTKLKFICEQDTKNAERLNAAYAKKATQLKNEFTKNEAIKPLLATIGVTAQDIIDAKIGEIDFAEFDKEQIQTSLQDNSMLAIENSNDADALFAAFLDDKEPAASTPLITSAHLAQTISQTMLERFSTNKDCSDCFKLIDRLIIAGQVNVDLKMILDEAPDLSLDAVDKLITNIYIVLITLFTQKLSTARLHPLTTNNEQDTLAKTIDQIKAYKEAHTKAPHFGSYPMKKMHLQLQLENIARIIDIATPQLNAQLSLPAPATPLPTAKEIYFKAARSLWGSLWAAPAESNSGQPMQRITANPNPNTPLLMIPNNNR